MLAKLALDVLREPRPAVVHREQHSGDLELRVKLALDQGERVEKLGKAFERQVLGLDGDDHAVRCHQRVHRERAQGGRTVEHDLVEAVVGGADRLAKTLLGGLEPRQLNGRAGEVGRGRHEREVRDRGRATGGRQLVVAQQAGVRVGLEILRDPERHGRVALRIEVDEERTVAGLGHAGGHVHRRGGLPDAALLVRHRVYGRHRIEDSPRLSRNRSHRADSTPNSRFLLSRGESTGWFEAELDPGSASNYLPPSGRLRAIPARRGIPGGVGSCFSKTWRCRRRDPGNGTTGCTPCGRIPTRREAEAPRRSSASSRVPFQATRKPPSASSGLAYSTSVGRAATARASASR